jgi:hypothetical protein
VDIVNNIFCKVGNGPALMVNAGQDAWSAPTELDYDLYSTGRPDNCIVSFYSSTTGSQIMCTLSKVQSFGYELHGAMGTPTFLNSAFGLGMNSSLNDLHLTAPVCVGGVNFSQLFSADKDGIARQPGGAWSPGAYTYVLSPPSNLQIMP